MIGALLFALAQVTSGGTASAQPESSANLRVYLLTMGPGDQVWEKFGHNAIWIHDPSSGSDVAYHWGLFDFGDKDFVPRFIQGRMRYAMGAFDMEQTVDSYRRANRTVWAQELNLAPDEKAKLAAFVAWNVQPENRFYDYDYFRDNCSTRVRDAIDLAMSGFLNRASASRGTATTYRFHTARLTQDDWPLFTGTMMGLGQPTDRAITEWEEMFLPVRMMMHLRGLSVETPQGSRPLVASERVLFQSTRSDEPTDVNRGVVGYAVIAAVVIALGALLLVTGRPGGATSALALAALWQLVAGLGGFVLAYLWLFTDHLYSYRNENLFHLNPLSLIAATLLLRVILVRRRQTGRPLVRAWRDAYYACGIVAGLSMTGFVGELLPGLDQTNGWIITLALPIHLGCLALLIRLRPEPAAA